MRSFAPMLALLVVGAGFVGPLVKVRPGELPETSRSAVVHLAGNECEGVQLVVPPPAQRVELELSRPSGPGAPLKVRLFREGFVEVRTPSNGEGAPGLWPDPLIEGGFPFDSTAERPLVAYVELCAAADQKPGRYTSRVTVRTRRGRSRLSLVAEVWPFSLPATSTLPNSFGISRYTIAKGHRVEPSSDAARKLLHEYAATLLEHRLSAHGMGMDPPPARVEGGEVVVDFSAYDEEMAPFLDGRALDSGARFTTTDVRDWRKAPSDEARVKYYRAFREHFAQKGWKAQLFFYAKDEPKPAEAELVRRQARLARAAGLPVLVTSALDDRFAPSADILCPTLNCFFPRRGPPTCPNPQPAAALRRALPSSARVWWYQSCNAHGCHHGPFDDPAIERAYSGWASYMIDHPAPRNRAMGPLAFLAGVDGELYFDTVHAFRAKDPWRDLFAFGGNGDGTLFYPGRDGPVPSLRLKHIRDGLEDYEYLRLAERVDPAWARTLVQRLVRSGFEVTLDPATWESARAELARRIDAASRGSRRPAGRERISPTRSPSESPTDIDSP